MPVRIHHVGPPLQRIMLYRAGRTSTYPEEPVESGMRFHFLGGAGGGAVSYPLDILDWRFWEIVAMLGISVSYFCRSISVRMLSKELDELY